MGKTIGMKILFVMKIKFEILIFYSIRDFMYLFVYIHFSRWIQLIYSDILQDVLSSEDLSLKFLDVAKILLRYCGPKSNEKGETQAVIIDLIATIGFFCANNRINQVNIIEIKLINYLNILFQFFICFI